MNRNDEIEKELRFHLEERTADLAAQGIPLEDARRRAQVEFGGLAQTRELTREQRSPWRAIFGALWHDVRYAFRRLRAAPGFAAAVIVTLAVGIAANTVTFTIVNAVLLKPLPVPDADRIVLMSDHYPKIGNPGPSGFIGSSVPDYYDRLGAMTTTYDEQAMFSRTAMPFQIDGTPVQIPGMFVTPSLFRLLRVSPERGRIFEEREGEEANPTRLILSHGLAQELFGSADSALGQTIQLSRPFTVVGVMPPAFEFGEPGARFWMPLVFRDEQKTDEYRHSNNWQNVARLKPGATLEQAQAQLDALDAGNMERLPQLRELLVNAAYLSHVERFQDMLVRGVRPTIELLWGGALVVLLICAVNVMNLTLARASVRTKEFATRLALGASRLRVARMLIVEGMILALTGAGIGLALGAAIVTRWESLGLDQLPRANEIALDWRVVWVTVVAALGIGLSMGAVPFAFLTRLKPGTLAGRDGRGGSAGKGTRAVRRVLVVAQVASTFILLTGAGLLFTSFRNLLMADPGFVSENVVTAEITLLRSRYPADDDVRGFTTRVLEALRRIPGVTEAGATTTIPLAGVRNSSAIVPEGYQARGGESVVAPTQVRVTPGYFKALGIGLLRGRYFTEADNEEAGEVVIVDEHLGRRFWPAGNPVGKRVYTPATPQDMVTPGPNVRWLTVVGVIRPVQAQDLAGGPDMAVSYYLPAAQRVSRTLVLAVKTAVDPAAVLPSVREQLRQIDPRLPLSDVRTMTDRMSLSLTPRRVAMLIVMSFAFVALFLSALGIYGVLAYMVAQRTRELAIRVALGSTAGGIFKLVLREGAPLTLIGLAIGFGGAIGLRGLLQAQVYGVSTLDPVVIGITTTILAAIALLACVLPARRASHVDPVLVLGQV